MASRASPGPTDFRMSTASNRPPAPTATSSPYSRLPDARTTTATRVKSGQAAPDAEIASGVADSEAPSPTSAISVEALRKPYASLPPQRRSETPAPSSEDADRVPSVAPQSRRTDPSRRVDSDSRRWTDTTEARRKAGVCSKHGIARAPSGDCMLCKKEQVAPRSSLLLWIGVGLVGAIAAFSTYLYLF